MNEPVPPLTARAGQREISGRVGKYEIRNLLGRGAMGVVYRAYDTVLERDVALKVMAASMGDDPKVYDRFVREAKAVARLTHPNVVTVFDLGSHTDGSPYIAMELLEGQDLARSLRTPPELSLERKLNVVLQVLAGLGHAHRADIVHRDIKPANIFLSRDGTVKIMDFGIARLTTASLTGTGTIMGTADYMSPEQVQAAKVDGRSDLFSMGCVLYELLVGERPFHADELMAIFYRITHQEPDLERVGEAALVAVLRKALAKDAARRYQSAEEFAADLRSVMASLSLRPATLPSMVAAPTLIGEAVATLPGGRAAGREPTQLARPGSRRLLYAGLGAGLLVALGLAGALLLRTRPQPAVATAPGPPAAGPALPTAQPPVTVAAQPAALPTAAPAGTAPAAGSSSPPARELEERATAGQRAQEAERLAAQEAERRAAQEAQQRAQGQVNALLGQAEAALAAQGYDAAIEGFNRVLALDPQNARALQGRSGAIAARAIAQAARANPAAPAAPGHAFVAGRTVPHAAEGESRPVPEGFSDTPGVTVKRGSQGAELPGKILFEVEPEAVAANTSYKVRIYLLNEGNAPILIRDMVVGTELNKRMARGPLPPLAREVGPRQKALLREISGTWKQDTASWSMEVLLRTERGEAYENRLTWK